VHGRRGVSDPERTELAASAVDSLGRRGDACTANGSSRPDARGILLDGDATDAGLRLRRVTYIDADVWFLADPQAALRGFSASGKSVQVTEHAFGAEHLALHAAGRFCVQFMTFVRERSERVRAWWEERCLEWCYARWEDGRFGDQMYLEDWPERFADDVHVLDTPAMCQGPWNGSRFNASDAVMFHFHGLRLARGAHVWLTTAYTLSSPSLDRFYRPYAIDLSAAITDLRAAGHDAPICGSAS
jgi:hypothetical protein